MTAARPGARGRAAAVLAVSLALFAGACNRGPAEEALATAGQALDAGRADLERYEPEQLAALDAILKAARADLARGRYTDALRAAHPLPARIESAVAAAAAKKARLAAVWSEMSGRLPGRIRSISDEVAALAGRTSLPWGMTTEALAGAQAELVSLGETWREATAAFESGDVARAVELAEDVEARSEALAGAVGLVAGPEAVAAR